MTHRSLFNLAKQSTFALLTIISIACQGSMDLHVDADAGPTAQSNGNPEVGSASLRATSGELLTLDASNFLGLSGASYTWSQLSGPTISIGDPSAEMQTFVAPSVSEVDFVIVGLDAVAGEIAVKTVITITIIPAGTSVPPSCDDGAQNGDETDVDCGGSCPACLPEETCGDNICSSGEDCSACEWDCGRCSTPDVCGTLADSCHSDPLGDSRYCSERTTSAASRRHQFRSPPGPL